MDEKMDKQYVITKDEMDEIWNAGHSMDLDTLDRMVFTLPALPVAPDVDNHCVCTFDIEDQGHQLEECDYHKALYARYEKRIGVIRMNYDICLAELAQEEEEHKQHHTEIDSLRTDITKLEEEQDLHIDLIDADHEKEIADLRTELEDWKLQSAEIRQSRKSALDECRQLRAEVGSWKRLHDKLQKAGDEA